MLRIVFGAGVQIGGTITRVMGTATPTKDAVVAMLKKHPSGPVEFTIDPPETFSPRPVPSPVAVRPQLPHLISSHNPVCALLVAI